MTDSINQSSSNLTEVWVPVRGYEGMYEVSNHGRVKSIRRTVRRPPCGRSLKPSTMTYPERILATNSRVYPRVELFANSVGRQVDVHRLVAEHFLEGSGQVVRHLDGNPKNPAASNLAWGTYKDNEADKDRHGRRHRGELHHNAKWTREEIDRVKAMTLIDSSDLRISRLTGVARSTVYLIRKGQAWTSEK